MFISLLYKHSRGKWFRTGYWLCSMNSPGNQGLSRSELCHAPKGSVPRHLPTSCSKTKHTHPKEWRGGKDENKVKMYLPALSYGRSLETSRWHFCPYPIWPELIHRATLASLKSHVYSELACIILEKQEYRCWGQQTISATTTMCQKLC